MLRGNTRAGAEWSARARRSRSQGASTRAVATPHEVESNAVESNHQSIDQTEITAREGAARRGLPLGVGAISTPATPDAPNQETALLRRLVDLTDPVRLRRAAERVPQLVRIPAEWRERVTIDGAFVGLGLLMAAIAWFGI